MLLCIIDNTVICDDNSTSTVTHTPNDSAMSTSKSLYESIYDKFTDISSTVYIKHDKVSTMYSLKFNNKNSHSANYNCLPVSACKSRK